MVVPLRPFFGSMGVAPPRGGRAGEQQSAQPLCRQPGQPELVAGSTLFIPVFVPGALFAVGDGHAAQGDGEVEPDGDRDLAARTPQAHGAQGRVADLAARGDADRLHQHGRRSGSDRGDRIAIQEMVDFLARTRGFTKHQAYQLVSVAGHVAVTQLVDKPTMGVHVKVPKSLFK